MISVKTNIAQFINTEIKRYKNITRQATWSASNKVTQQAKTQAVKSITEEYNIKKSDFNKYILVTKPDNNYVSYIRVARGKESLPLMKFGKPRQTDQGVWVQVKRTKMDLLPGHFIAKMKSGHKGIFTREPMGSVTGQVIGKVNPGQRKWLRDKKNSMGVSGRVGRLPIDEKYSKAAAHIVTKNVFEKIKAFVHIKYPALLEHEMKRRLNQ